MSDVVWDVLGIGENSVDDVLLVPSFPGGPDEARKIPILARRRTPGGQVATTLATCAAFGLRTAYVGVFGHDDAGAFVRGELERRGIDTSLTLTKPVPTRTATILVREHDGERVVLWHRHPGLTISGSEVGPDVLMRARAIHVDAVDVPAALHIALAARTLGVPVTSDIDTLSDDTISLARTAAVAIFAEHVPAAATGEREPGAALHALRARLLPDRPMLCVTCGARGAVLLAGDDLYREPGIAIRPVDTTGAGDVFRGAFLTAWLRGEPPARVLRFANAAAALSCTREGAIGGIPGLDEVHALAGEG